MNFTNLGTNIQISSLSNLSLTSFSTDGDMDDDGFYYAELNGKRGLVPSNYVSSLQDYPGKYI